LDYWSRMSSLEHQCSRAFPNHHRSFSHPNHLSIHNFPSWGQMGW
jgi:hypothetical protein